MERQNDVTDLRDESDVAAERRATHSVRRKQTGKRKFRFEIGRLATSEKVMDKMEENRSFADFYWSSFGRHCLCDWGNVSLEEKEANAQAIKDKGRLFSSYTHPIEPWIICILTESDRSETMIGLPEDFDLAGPLPNGR
jgi:hypothetical protein